MSDFALNGPAEIVQDKYQRSIDLANRANSEVSSFQAALNASIYTPPTVSVTWQTLPAPNLPEVGELPQMPDVSLTVPEGIPAAFAGLMREVVIDDFAVQPPALEFGQAPEIRIGTAPSLPSIREVAIPQAPEIALPEVPQFLQLSTHSFGGVDLHEDWLRKLEDIPALSLLEPVKFSYVPGQRYASQLLGNLKAMLDGRIHGGTGLNPAVEQRIWERARDRETQLALAREADVMRSAQAFGFPLPSGVMVGQLADARREFFDKLSGLSRDVAIKQAELEQQNLKDSIAQALQLESTLMDDSYKLEMLTFEASKAAADNALGIHNARLQEYQALLESYKAYASAYEVLVRSEMNKVEVFKALLAAEQIKAEINKSLTDRYRVEIEASMSAVEVYKARVSAAQTLVELEKTRLSAGAEQIKAFVASVGAETAKSELYKAQVQAEGMKQEAYRNTVQAYGLKAGAQAEMARVELAKFQGQLAAKQLEWDGWKSKLSAASYQVEAAVKKSSILMDGYRVGAAATEAQASSYMRRWEADIKQYEASTSLTLQAAKINADAVMHTNDARLEAAKLGLGTAAQRAASAWSMVSASAQISGSVTQSISSPG